MNDFNIHVYVPILILLFFSLKSGGLFNLFLILLLLYMSPSKFTINAELIFWFLFYFILGIFISKKIVKLFFSLFFKKNFSNYNIKYVMPQLLIALKEEIMWRYLLVYFIYIPIIEFGYNSILAFLIAEMASYFSFISIHLLENRKSLLEFCSFLMVLTILSFIMPGLNVSLHMTRNVLIISNLGVNYEKAK